MALQSSLALQESNVETTTTNPRLMIIEILNKKRQTKQDFRKRGTHLHRVPFTQVEYLRGTSASVVYN